MSNHNKQTNYNFALDFAENEINKLKDEIKYLLENSATKEDIKRIEQRVEEFENIFYKISQLSNRF